jgi:hypothetical protein
VSGAALRHWQQMRSPGDLQFAPLPPEVHTPPPGWLTSLEQLLKALFGPVGRALGIGWPVVETALVVIGALVLALLAWRLIARLASLRRTRAGVAAEDWAPGREQALALLDEADRLAAAHRFDEAAHLLLLRGVAHIAAARPEWLHPASTAREIAGLHALPQRARDAFALIAARVEQSRYALRPLAAADWQAARAAYADFALQRLDGAPA